MLFMRCLVSLLLTLVVAGPVLADPSIVIRTLNLQTSIPAPPWTEYARIAKDSESIRTKELSSAGTDVFMRAYVPKGQNFENWDERYEVMAESPVIDSAQTSRDTFAASYVEACVNAVLAPVLDEPERQVFVLFCPSFRDAPDFGEVVVAVAAKRGDTLVQVNYLQRFPAFDVMDDNSLPKTHEEILEIVTYLNAAHLVPS